MQLLNFIIFWFFLGLLTAHFAKKRGRHPLAWFFIAFFLSITGLILLFCLPKMEKKSTHALAKSLRPLPAKKSEAWLKMWYYLDPSHTQQGPFEFPDLIKKWKEKGIGEHSFIWGEGMSEWKKLSEIPELVREFDQA